MNRNLLNYLIDMTALVAGFFCSITGLIKWPGLVYALGLSYQSLPMDALTWIHDWTGIVLILLVALHIMMHLRWMIAMTEKIAGAKVSQNEKT